MIALSALGESHAPELARLLGLGVTTTRNALDTLERAGLVVGIMKGNTRRVQLNPRFTALTELKALLDKLLVTDPALLTALAGMRRRPRRMGKEL
ncbi:ArsR family transcriptional regulator [bacterium]|nr:MAG: ArsR family transcriptional regulator [bacterium]